MCCNERLYYIFPVQISKDPAVYPRPCVYMLYEPEVRTGDAALAAAQEGGQDEEESSNVEIRIAPQHENSGLVFDKHFQFIASSPSK